MFAFEGNGVIMNVRAEAKNKDKYPTNLVIAMMVLITVYMFNATLCYFTFGNTVGDFVTLNLLPMDGLAIFMVCLFCFNALSSYPL
jgi:hypothetical protein